MNNPCWCTDPERSDCFECSARNVDTERQYEAILYNLRESLGLRKDIRTRGQKLRRIREGHSYD